MKSINLKQRRAIAVVGVVIAVALFSALLWRALSQPPAAAPVGVVPAAGQTRTVVQAAAATLAGPSPSAAPSQAATTPPAAAPVPPDSATTAPEQPTHTPPIPTNPPPTVTASAAPAASPTSAGRSAALPVISLSNAAGLAKWAGWAADTTDARSWQPILYFPNRTQVATLGTGNAVWIRSASDGSLIRALEGPTGPAYDLALAQGGGLLAAASEDGNVWVWDTATGDALKTFRVYTPLYHVALSLDGRYLAAANQTTIWLWKIDEKVDSGLASLWKVVKTDINGLAFSPSGTKLAASGDTIQVWSVPDGGLIQSISPQGKSIVRMAFSSDGSTLATGVVGGLVLVIRVSDGSTLNSFFAGTAQASSLAYSPDGRFLVVGYYDKTLRFWDLQMDRATKAVQEISLPGVPLGMTFSPDGRLLALSFPSGIQLWGVGK